MPFKKVDELAVPVSVRVRPSDKAYISGKYGTLGSAIRTLAQGGAYEQAVEKMLDLEEQLKKLRKKH